MLVLIDGSLHQAHAELDELSMASDSTGGALAHMRERMREESDKLAAEIAAHQGDLGQLEALRCEHGNARAALAALAALVTALGNFGENLGENLGERDLTNARTELNTALGNLTASLDAHLGEHLGEDLVAQIGAVRAVVDALDEERRALRAQLHTKAKQIEMLTSTAAARTQALNQAIADAKQEGDRKVADRAAEVEAARAQAARAQAAAEFEAAKIPPLIEAARQAERRGVAADEALATARIELHALRESLASKLGAEEAVRAQLRATADELATCDGQRQRFQAAASQARGELDELRQALAKMLASIGLLRSDKKTLVEQVQELIYKFNMSNRAVEHAHAQLDASTRIVAEIVADSEQRSKAAVLGAEQRVHQMQQERRHEREVLVQTALASLRQLRSHLTATLSGLRAALPVDRLHEALAFRAESQLGEMASMFGDLRVCDLRGAHYLSMQEGFAPLDEANVPLAPTVAAAATTSSSATPRSLLEQALLGARDGGLIEVVDAQGETVVVRLEPPRPPLKVRPLALYPRPTSAEAARHVRPASASARAHRYHGHSATPEWDSLKGTIQNGQSAERASGTVRHRDAYGAPIRPAAAPEPPPNSRPPSAGVVRVRAGLGPPPPSPEARGAPRGAPWARGPESKRAAVAACAAGISFERGYII